MHYIGGFVTNNLYTFFRGFPFDDMHSINSTIETKLQYRPTNLTLNIVFTNEQWKIKKIIDSITIFYYNKE